MYPLFLELTVEACFPVEESIPVALISISTAVQSVILMELDSALAKPLMLNNLDQSGLNNSTEFSFRERTFAGSNFNVS